MFDTTGKMMHVSILATCINTPDKRKQVAKDLELTNTLLVQNKRGGEGDEREEE